MKELVNGWKWDILNTTCSPIYPYVSVFHTLYNLRDSESYPACAIEIWAAWEDGPQSVELTPKQAREIAEALIKAADAMGTRYG